MSDFSVASSKKNSWVNSTAKANANARPNANANANANTRPNANANARPNANSNANYKPAFKIQCKYCENLNLPSDHWLRTKDGATACPVLLANKCSYCHLPGHTIKQCAELIAKNERFTLRQGTGPATGNDTGPATGSWKYSSNASSVSDAPHIACEPIRTHTHTFSRLSLIHPDNLEVLPDPDYFLSTDEFYNLAPKVSAPPIIQYQCFVSSIYEKYKNRRWADITDSDSD